MVSVTNPHTHAHTEVKSFGASCLGLWNDTVAKTYQHSRMFLRVHNHAYTAVGRGGQEGGRSEREVGRWWGGEQRQSLAVMWRGWIRRKLLKTGASPPAAFNCSYAELGPTRPSRDVHQVPLDPTESSRLARSETQNCSVRFGTAPPRSPPTDPSDSQQQARSRERRWAGPTNWKWLCNCHTHTFARAHTRTHTLYTYVHW